MPGNVKIGMILDADRGFPPDIRVEKEAKALIAAGFEVAVLARKPGPSQLREWAQGSASRQRSHERLDSGIEVHRTEIPDDSTLLTKLSWSATLVNKHWLSAIDDFVTRARPAVLHAHDLTTVPAALRIAKRRGLPIVADLHENMPAAMVAYRSNLSALHRLKSSVVSGYKLWRWHERRCLRQCSAIIVVVPEAAERLLNDYGIEPEKVHIVSNTEDETTFDVGDKAAEPTAGDLEGPWTALYIGGIGPHRGIDTLVRAAGTATREIPNFRLLLVGVQRDDQRREILSVAEKANASRCLDIVSWVPSHEVHSYIRDSNVCLVPHNFCEHTNTTVPHKLFQYMISRKPVIVSSCAPLRRIVEDAEAGLVFEANDSGDLARCLVKLYEGGSRQAREYGENGRRAAVQEYSWKHDRTRLVNMYRGLFSSRGLEARVEASRAAIRHRGAARAYQDGDTAAEDRAA